MFKDGTKILHAQSPNCIYEMVDSFNVAGLQMGNGAKISLIVGRDTLKIREETLIPEPAFSGFKSTVLPDAMVMERLVVANLSIPLEAAKALVKALNDGIAQMEENLQAQPTAHG
ncbi:hypothetical protein [Pseudomonas savastanoi]|uniref:Uncharacterized protein n=1 Tax=Pseudomonas savastanoi TaxID=29438 RepID=A0AAW3LZN4_PSESS|nr:hypothetical protein [Pseudomonas savastanoi]KTC59078.1 hypothetical protein AO287_21540 [Pseudomonas savastanoi]